MMKQIVDLDFHIFQTSDPGEQTALNERCFELWEHIWIDTFKELQVHDKPVHSDDYLSKELGGLFLGDKPVGFLMYHFCDMKKRTHQKMSYFHNYPKHLYQNVISAQDQVMVITYMTLDPEWRKSLTDLPISELLIGFSVLRFMESQSNRLIGYFRNNRGTNDIFYRHGGLALLKGETAYNVEVDFAQITRRSARLSTLPGCADMTFLKWKEHKMRTGETHHDERNLEFRESEAIAANFPGNALDKQGIL
jgi:hypothetical protein